MFRTLRSPCCGALVRAAPPTPPHSRRRPTAPSKASCATRAARRCPGVTVTVTNTDTGRASASVTNDDGVYRALAAAARQLRRRRRAAGLQEVRTAGHHALGRPDRGHQRRARRRQRLRDGDRHGESPVAQPGKIDLGRTIGESEVKNLPLVSRNPYNFAFLQANVTGYENNEFGVPRINANGTQMHTNYQLDGNTNTEKDRAGLRCCRCPK